MDGDEARQRLSDERQRLQRIADTFAGDGLTGESEYESLSELSSVDQHQADVGTDTFDRERDLSILEQVEAELAEVEHALRRIDDGTYGSCEACGVPVGDERLAAVPEARFCIADQAAAEREARVGPSAE
ncbi:MAG: TraR/DksA C4-type zinc finger protein [Acidimicrobiales bacterium]